MAITSETKNATKFLTLVTKLEPTEFLGLAKMLGVTLVEKDVDCGQPIEEQDEATGQEKPGFKARAAEDILQDVVVKYMSLERKGRRNVMQLLKTATKQKK